MMADNLRPSTRVKQKKIVVDAKSVAKRVEEIKDAKSAENGDTAQSKSSRRTKRCAVSSVINTSVSSSEKRQKLAVVDVTTPTDARTKSVRSRRGKSAAKDDESVTANAPKVDADLVKADAAEDPVVLNSESPAESVKKNSSRLPKSKGKNAKKAVIKDEDKPEEVCAEVDAECILKANKAHVYQSGANIYDAMLNQTYIANNNNKFFLLQVLEDDGPKKKYSVWLRWGRVGFRGQTKLIECGTDSEIAIRIFKEKFYDKTKNQFEDRLNFKKCPGKYDLIQIDYTKKNEPVVVKNRQEKEKKKEVKSPPPSCLEERVRSVMELICDLNQMERDIQSMEYDVKKCPLGNISKAQVKAGFESLSAIEQHINRNDFGITFLEALNNYYTRIPHCFGMRVPPHIRTVAQLKNEITLLETLADIELVVTALSKNADDRLKEEQTLHPLDIQYQQLRWTMTPVEHDSKLFKVISTYMGTSHGKTHTSYRLSVRNVFELNLNNAAIDEENRRFREEIGNITLLWHGSRMSNWFGILSQGLRIAPPEAPVTGYMFGKGVYFADSSSKSANYTLPEPRKTRFMVLSEVALGNINELYTSNDRADRLPPGKNSVSGVGRYYPDPSGDVTIDGVRVPCGKFLERKKLDRMLQLLYNEFIVYDTRQIRERYLVEVNFDFDFNL